MSSAAAALPQQEERERDGALLGLAPGELATQLRRLDWSFEEARDGGSVHSLHPYPARFVSALPRRLIALLSEPGDLIVDPFSGGGTTAVEALDLDRGFLGIDANPVGNVVARAKTRSVNTADSTALRDFEATLLAQGPAELAGSDPSWLPSIPNRSKWYDDDVFRALGAIRDLVLEIQPEAARELALVAFVQAATRLSFQESETRYVSAPREMEIIEAQRAVLSELRRIRRLSENLPKASPAPQPTFVDGDARDRSAFQVADGSVGLIVTSPPYPNTYDYHLYHRFRLFWLGDNPKILRRVEIGSHLKNQTLSDPVDTYLSDMGAVLENCLEALAPGRYAAIVVGDGLFKGRVFQTSESLAKLGCQLGYDHVTTLDRPLPRNRRSVTKAGRRLTSEQILVLRRPPADRSAVASPPNYELYPYEAELRMRELNSLGGCPRLGTNGEIEVVPVPQLDQAAFSHAIRFEGGEAKPTVQCRLEGAPTTATSRKNSTYLGHGLHRYKGKFYPQLAKSLLNLSGLERGKALVMDPFGGSGTVALEATLGGFDAVSYDCNPLAAATARAKLALASAKQPEVTAQLRALRRKVETAPSHGSRELSQFATDLQDELHRWFAPPVLAKLDWLLQAIRETDGDVTIVFEVLASDLIRDVSQQDPGDLRVRRRKEPLVDAPIYEFFVSRLNGLENRIASYVSEFGHEGLEMGSATIVQGDVSSPDTFAALAGRLADAVVSSPPYAAALPYLDTDRLSLAAIFGYSRAARRNLEQAMIGSREITKRQQAAYAAMLASDADGKLPDSTREFLLRFSEAVDADPKAGFRRRQAPAVLLRYFVGMQRVLSNVANHLHRGGACWLVLGNSSSTIGGRKWTIPTINEVAAIAENAGMTLVDRLPITVTREGMVHTRHAITRNEVLHLQR